MERCGCFSFIALCGLAHKCKKLSVQFPQDGKGFYLDVGVCVKRQIQQQRFAQGVARDAVQGQQHALRETGVEQLFHLCQVLLREGCDVVEGGPEAQRPGELHQEAHREIGKVGLQCVEGKDAPDAPVEKAVFVGAVPERAQQHLGQEQRHGIFLEILEKLGRMPLPPYIKAELKDPERYQTVYSRELGSAAAPTAGLHFTPELLEEIRQKGVSLAWVTLHVGLGTFRPVKEDQIEDHEMHSEFCIIPAETAEIVNRTKTKGGRVIAVGTTSCRTLESFAKEDGSLEESSGWTNIFIYPGYSFKCIDALITNFHLPESTLIMLVSALAGRENILKAYKTAVDNRYRFFSFGDAMFIE